VAGELVLDTGALVSILDRSQRQHHECRLTFEAWTAPIVSTEAVLTEASHLLSSTRGGIAACVDFFLSGGALLVPTSSSTLRRARTLILKYADQQMDFADATLVALAEDLATDLVFTTDKTDFSVYRLHGRRPFTILP
jgi:predicted nucleic acid-binding protein